MNALSLLHFIGNAENFSPCSTTCCWNLVTTVIKMEANLKFHIKNAGVNFYGTCFASGPVV